MLFFFWGGRDFCCYVVFCYDGDDFNAKLGSVLCLFCSVLGALDVSLNVFVYIYIIWMFGWFWRVFVLCCMVFEHAMF